MRPWIQQEHILPKWIICISMFRRFLYICYFGCFFFTQYARGIAPLIEAIQKIQLHPAQLTSIHGNLCQVSIELLFLPYYKKMPFLRSKILLITFCLSQSVGLSFAKIQLKQKSFRKIEMLGCHPYRFDLYLQIFSH